MTSTQFPTCGPLEARVRWVADEEPYDVGDAEDPAEVEAYINQFGVMGCIVETRAPACGCCGRTDWEVATSLWSIVGDEDYHREIERDLLLEV